MPPARARATGLRWPSTPRGGRPVLLGLAALAAVLAAGCATSTGEVVLLPAQDGHKSVLAVKQGDREIVLDKPYAAVETTTRGPRAFESSAKDVEAKFGNALAAQPARPQSFTLNFVEGSNELTDESKRVLESVLPDIRKHAVPDIVVIGHTDSVGTDAYNDKLSLQRADAVRDALIARGIPAGDIVAEGRGKRDPLVATGEGVSEARNRRVEIIVR